MLRRNASLMRQPCTPGLEALERSTSSDSSSRATPRRCAWQGGKPVPRGSGGHDIIAILDRAGVGRAVLPAAVRKFAESRDVGLRYQVSLPEDVDLEHELHCARRLVQWCVTRLNRPTRRRR
jgi:hypothetical protein